MGSLEMLDAVSEIIVTAREGIFEAVSSLSTVQRDDRAHADVLDVCQSQVDNVAMVAEMAEVTGLQRVCGAINEHLASVAGDTSAFTAEDGQRLVDWADHVLAFLQQPDDDALIKPLLAPLPAARREGLLEALMAGTGEAETNDSVAHSASEDTHSGAADAEPSFGGQVSPVDEADEPAADGLLGILRDELLDVSQELSELRDIITAGEQEQDLRSAAARQYSDIVDRLLIASDAMGLVGLRDTCVFVNENMSHVVGLDANRRGDLRDALDGWPPLVRAYLNAPADEQRSLDLVNHLQNEHWPQSLGDPQARHLLEALAAQPVVVELSEDIEARQTVAQAEDVQLGIFDDVNQELIDAFFQESPGHAAELSSRVERIAAGDEVLDNVGAAQRLTHTIKGAANLIGARGVASLTHHLEDILEHLAAQKVVPMVPLAYTLQEAADCVEIMFDALQGKEAPPQDALRILQDVLDWANRLDAGQFEEPPFPQSAGPETAEPSIASAPLPPAQTETPGGDGATQPIQQASPAQAVSGDVLRVPTPTVDEMFRLVGEMSISIGQMQEYLKRVILQGEDLRLHDALVQQRRFDLENVVDVRSMATMQRRLHSVGGGHVRFDPLELDRYGEVYQTVHGFIEAVSDSREMTLRLNNQLLALDGLFMEQQRINKELQQIVVTTRMVSVDSIASRLQRSVRQACRTTGNHAELEISGAELLVDGDVLSKLADPIMHLLRNAVDHGIESPEEREADDKPRVGRVRLEFSKDRNNVVVCCEDDGRGLDYVRIRTSAVEKGLLGSQENPDRQALARLILTPGFSTRTAATQISGRGVGMDVVNTAIQQLKGTMEIGESELSGCQITLRLPTTLVTSHSALVKVQNEPFAIPTNALTQILAPGVGEFSPLGSDLSYRFGKEIYPAKSLASVLGLNVEGDTGIDNSKTVLLVRTDRAIVAIAVDRVVTSNDLVIKGMGRYVRSVHGVLGVAILGDGSVVAVLDLPELLRTPAEVTSSPQKLENSLQPAASNLPRVLIVDDSLSVRKSLSQLMADAGYEIDVARDGLDALNVLSKRKPDVVLADLEMPRMNGLELTSHIRANTDLNDLPVIMITSRTMQKHREQAERAGVNAYVTKPYAEEELLNTVSALSRKA